MSNILDGSDFEKITGSQLVVTGPGVVSGFIVNSHASGTLKFWDSTTASGEVIMNTFTFDTGLTSGQVTFPRPISFQTGLFATIGGTADITILFNKAS